MDEWDARAFAKALDAGELRGRLNEELANLSEEQLTELLRVLTENKPEKSGA